MTSQPATQPASPSASERRTLVVPRPGVVGLLHSLSVFESLSATGRLVVALADSEPASLVYATLLHLRLRDRPKEDLSVPLCLHGDAGLETRRLRDLGFHEAVLLTEGLRDAQRVALAGIAERWGLPTRGVSVGGWLRSRLLGPVVRRRKPTPGEPAPWAGDDARPLLDAVGVPWRRRVLLEQSESFAKVGAERLERAKITPGEQPLVGVYLGKGDAEWRAGSAPGPAWPDLRWQELLRRLRKQRPDVRFVLVQGAGVSGRAARKELWRCVQLHESTGRLHPVLGPELDLLGIAAVLRHLDLLVGRGDTWPVQLAAALGTRVCGLFDGEAGLEGPRGRLVPPRGPQEPQESAAPPHLVTTTPLSKLSVDEVVDAVSAAL